MMRILFRSMGSWRKRSLEKGMSAVALLMAACSGSGISDETHYYCSATTVIGGGGQTLVITGHTYAFNGPAASFPVASPRLQSSFAAYVANTWPGLSIAPTCQAQSSEGTAETAREAEVGSYESQNYGIWRVGYWHPPPEFVGTLDGLALAFGDASLARTPVTQP